jgi:hypothetical protein
VAKVRTALTASLMTMLLALAWASPAAAQEDPEDPDRCEQFNVLQPVCEGLEPILDPLSPVFDGLEELEPLAEGLDQIIDGLRDGLQQAEPACEVLEPLVEGAAPLIDGLQSGLDELRQTVPDPAVLGPIGERINDALDLIDVVLELCAAQEPEPEQPEPEPAPEEEEEDTPPPAEPAPAPLPRTGGTATMALLGALAFGAGFAGLRGNRRRF